MNLITIEHLKKSYTERLLFDDASFFLEEGDKVGLIGINGTGKSTLLRIAAGLEEEDEGYVVRGNHLTIRFLPQNPEFAAEETVLEAVLRENEGRGQIWDLEAQAKSMLNQLGILKHDEPVENLSGGQRKRVALASVLLSHADILILDEPTNHLDSEMADWLEEYLKKDKGALLMVTHDRYFLDSVTNRIVELDKGKLYRYTGNYEDFLKGKAERMDRELASERKRQSIFRVELEWMQRGARARATKQKAHIQRYEALRDKKSPQMDQQVEMESVSSRLGRSTVEVHGLGKAYGDKVLIKDFTYIFLKNDRIGIIGPNGAGKSTLLKMIAGWVRPDAGRVDIGQTVKLGYFSQENEQMDLSCRVIDYIRQAAEYVKTKDGSISASQMLERFLFPSSMQYTTIGKLSGGERRRLYLLRVLMDAPNVLMLDEPTNDLDIQTLTILEDYLDSFQGIVITVSHDRYFLDRIAERIFALEGEGKVSQYEGGFTDYQAAKLRKEAEEEQETVWKKGQKAEKPPAGGMQTQTSQKALQGQKKGGKDRQNLPQKLKFTYKEQKDWEHIEEEIAGLEETLSQLEKAMEEASSSYSKLQELMEQKEKAESILEEKMERWMYLSNLAEQIAAQK